MYFFICVCIRKHFDSILNNLLFLIRADTLLRPMPLLEFGILKKHHRSVIIKKTCDIRCTVVIDFTTEQY